MRFFEYESRAIVAKAGIPVTKHGFAKAPEEARRIAGEIGGPVVIKSQVLTGGRMKAGGVQFADTPDEAAQQAEKDADLAEAYGFANGSGDGKGPTVSPTQPATLPSSG